MRTVRIGGLGMSLLAVVFPSYAGPHHSETSDPSRWDYHTLTEVCGVLTRTEWRNPHVRMYVDVTNGDGRMTTWTFYFSAPGVLLRQFDRETFDRDLLPAGTPVRVEAFRQSDGDTVAGARTIARADGWMVTDGQFASRLPPEQRIPCATSTTASRIGRR